MNKEYSTLSIIPIIIAVLLLASCGKKDQSAPGSDSTKSPAAAIKEGQGTGILKAIDTSGKTLLLDAGNIPGIMEPMTMSYVVDRPELLSAAKVGDSVAFTIQDRGEGNFVVTAIKQMTK